ncbi:Ig-like domain-containing protein [Paraglaciecola aquimarina]|uniref:Ig-like domain-containing protein n=1 Tax=Paraglaciecola algarum TaxID=3050085 RepID=A0ABS9D5W5_9ALTE|nr:Ig-like domain-containing protein [Paraglaciecola sp. G1-23]MCF2948328.1 Ig-like domain-containing protein [Paraglaciecola sp. G1-23]
MKKIISLLWLFSMLIACNSHTNITTMPKQDSIEFVNPPAFLRIYKDAYQHSFTIKYEAKDDRDIALTLINQYGATMANQLKSVKSGTGELTYTFALDYLLDESENYQVRLVTRPAGASWHENIMFKNIDLIAKHDGKPIGVSGITLTPSQFSLKPNTTQFLKLNFTPAFVSNEAVTWQSSNPQIAQVTEHGVVKAIAEGTASISATTEDGNLVASSQVLVKTIAEKAVNFFEEKNGLLIMEAENLPYHDGGWELREDIRATGGFYIVWNDTNHYHHNTEGRFETQFKINTPGTYEVRMYTRQAEGYEGDKGNDVFLGFYGQHDVGPNDKPLPDYYKYVNRSTEVFGFGGMSSELADGLSGVVRLKIDKPGVYSMQLAARSKGFEIDRFIIFNSEKYSHKEVADRSLFESPILD